MKNHQRWSRKKQVAFLSDSEIHLYIDKFCFLGEDGESKLIFYRLDAMRQFRDFKIMFLQDSMFRPDGELIAIATFFVSNDDGRLKTRGVALLEQLLQGLLCEPQKDPRCRFFGEFLLCTNGKSQSNLLLGEIFLFLQAS